jgi:uncharacterized protein
MDLILLSLLGIFLGLASSVLGIGGGSMVVPAVMHTFPHLGAGSVTSTSLLFILMLTFINIYNFRKLGIVFHKKIIWIVGISCFIFGLLVSLVNISMPKHVFQLVFASTLFLVGIKVVTSKEHKGSNDKEIKIDEVKNWKLIVTGVFTGAISGLTGLGGGVLLIPLFISFLKFPFKVISAYSNAIMVFAVTGSLLPHLFTSIEVTPHASILLRYWVGDLPILLTLPLIILSPIGSKLGVRIDQKLSPAIKKKTYFTLLMLLSARLYYSAYLLF